LSACGSRRAQLQRVPGPDGIRRSPWLDQRHIRHLEVGFDEEASLEHFIYEQNIAIFRRLLSTLTDHDEARRQLLLKLLADAEAKDARSLQRHSRDEAGATTSTTPG
jgi:hypothetical protein